MDDNDQHYCLRWNNYQSNMTSVFHQLLQNEDFVDVTLACNDRSLKAHKVVLSACSAYFQKLLLENPCKHPTIIMPQDVGYEDLKFIIEFVYKGEIDVSQPELQSLLRTADQLKIKGLCETDDKENRDSREPLDLPLSLHCKSGRKSPGIKHHSLPEEDPPEAKYPKTSFQTIEDSNEIGSDKVQHKDTNKERENDREREKESENEQHSNEETEENDMPVASDQPEPKRKRLSSQQVEQTKPLNMTSHGLLSGQTIFSHFGVDTDDFPPEPPAPSAIPVGHVDMSTAPVDHSPTRTILTGPIHRTDISDSTKYTLEIKKEADIKLETLRSYDQDSLLDMESHLSGPDHSMDSHDDGDRSIHHLMGQHADFSGIPGVSNSLDVNNDDQVPGMKNNGHSENITPNRSHGGGPKTWTQEDMDMALDALRNHNMSLTKASATYGIPSTTLWQRAHRLGIDTPKKEGPTKSWTEENLNNALEALRTGTISANKASKAFGIPSSTLYKIARREGIRLAAPFNAAPTTWTPDDLEKALESIRTGQTSVQKASTEFGIPTGTLYGRCKREGIELSRSNPTPWSEDAMGEALEAVRLGHMSINQAAIHYNLPYSSLYGRFKRGLKFEADIVDYHDLNQDSQLQMDHTFGMEYTTSPPQIQYQNQNS
ncbi:protein bric-a-brac 2-like isoform X1 [Diorhabda sublineata]|uniref:protein bric-a-brac 2-like isoform X1 n=1 Tax=Diorhabda sublineata TaxID=1163346 RepID=UPI0024E191D9|nr:protein bric-a-brac 2-like isoform X1 [Diorhabda sublineata]